MASEWTVVKRKERKVLCESCHFKHKKGDICPEVCTRGSCHWTPSHVVNTCPYCTKCKKRGHVTEACREFYSQLALKLVRDGTPEDDENVADDSCDDDDDEEHDWHYESVLLPLSDLMKRLKFHAKDDEKATYNGFLVRLAERFYDRFPHSSLSLCFYPASESAKVTLSRPSDESTEHAFSQILTWVEKTTEVVA